MGLGHKYSAIPRSDAEHAAVTISPSPTHSAAKVMCLDTLDIRRPELPHTVSSKCYCISHKNVKENYIFLCLTTISSGITYIRTTSIGSNCLGSVSTICCNVQWSPITVKRCSSDLRTMIRTGGDVLRLWLCECRSRATMAAYRQCWPRRGRISTDGLQRSISC